MDFMMLLEHPGAESVDRFYMMTVPPLILVLIIAIVVTMIMNSAKDGKDDKDDKGKGGSNDDKHRK